MTEASSVSSNPEEMPYSASDAGGSEVPVSRLLALRPLLVAGVVVATAIGYSMRPVNAASAHLWAPMLLAYLSLALLSVIWKRETPLPILRPRGGDLTLGAMLGLFSVAAGILVLRVLIPPGSERGLWLFRLYAQAGDIQNSGVATLLLLTLVALEEFVWRRWVLGELRTLSPRSCAPLTALAYGIAHLPAYFTLGDPLSGGNPLLPLAALGGGLLWTYLTLLTNRLLPAIVAHAVFSYFLSAPWPSF
jgi:membrane protease YdiL (CAAX protease family)